MRTNSEFTKLEYSSFAGGYFDADKGELTRDELQALLK